MALRIPVDFIKDVISSILLFAFFYGLYKFFFVFGSSDYWTKTRLSQKMLGENFVSALRASMACMDR